MDRREALAALVALPAVTRISAADVKPGDVIVVECDHWLSIEMVAHIKASVEQAWPGRKFVICDKGMRIKVVGQ